MCFTSFLEEKKHEKMQNRELSRSTAKEMFLVFEMSLEVEAQRKSANQQRMKVIGFFFASTKHVSKLK